MRTRREFLGFLAISVGATGTGALAACGSSAAQQPTADDAARPRAAASARTLAALYETAITHGSIDRAQAAAYKDHHLAHARRLMPDTSDATGAVSSPTRESLAAAELAAKGTSATDIDAVSGDLAVILASVAACRALHAAALSAASLNSVQNPDTSAAPSLTATAASQAASPTATQASVDALQSLLAAEDAVIFAFGALGPHLTGSQRTSAHAAFDVHRTQRDVLTDAIVARGSAPQAADASYNLPFTVGDAASAGRLAALVETRLAAVCARAVSTSADETRTYAAWALTQAALRAQTWGTPITAFPGLSA